MRKLIRDRMGMHIGLGPGDRVSICSPEEYGKLLIAKLDEEYGEFRKEIVKNFVNVDNVLVEAGDLVEVIGAVADFFASANLACVLEQAKTKREAKGGFTAGIVLETK